ncbi:hypothetical protein JVT61DRAFT_10079 [Boletus reticuloceps]|uniref:Uncharacterized protein n=1 Tax=Boletus reticuloceps TaxID=495285 RepID=A0A8I2YWN8_9AGAM|nr:hypothetical protein JVT61DRAFT_10079 [Boletus reticuloceps]
MFTSRSQSMKMEHDMNMYTTIVAPLIRSVWALEAAHANASDVFVFSLAIGATLKDLFAQGQDKTGIPLSLVKHVTVTYNTRWKQFFTNDVYFTAFALDPRYPLSDFLMKPTLASATSIRIPPRNPSNKQASTSDHPMPHPRAYERVKEFLKNRLKIMLDSVQASNLDHTDELAVIVQKIGPVSVVEEFRHQLRTYWLGEWPFDDPVVNNDPYTWWETLKPT